jgi:NAD(P)-dependent dehydrogenase (short-subunit alcohol dehydrogenase family)
MLMSVLDGARLAPAYPRIAGKRVLITGLTSRCGVDVARVFAEHKTRLVLQFAETGQEMHTVAEIVAQDALEVSAFGRVGPQTDEVVRFARDAVKAFGGVDLVINFVQLSAQNANQLASVDAIERTIAERLAVPCLLSKIAANRMSLAWTEGLILNIATLPGAPHGANQAFAAVVKSTLAAMTRSLASEWADKAIRFNAIAPPTWPSALDRGALAEAEMAQLALELASGRGKTLSGCLFESAGEI